MNLLSFAVLVCAGLVYGSASPYSADDESGHSYDHANDTRSCVKQMTAFPIDPASRCCISTTPVSLGARNAFGSLYQDPWAVGINYKVKKTGELKRLCGGTLISAKYVLTSAHCVVGRMLKNYKPTEVRLGTMHPDGTACRLSRSMKICVNGLSIAIEKIIPHPEFHHRYNDIALIRLKKTAPYGDFYRPICLPTKNLEDNPPARPLNAVGWDKKNYRLVYTVPFVSQKKCKSIYGIRNVELNAGHICAGGIKGMDPCTGDGGAPLVYKNEKGLSELVGIVSFGPVPCGQQDVPSVYTNVYEYLDWIKATINAEGVYF